jgi:DNA-binding NarL/FixJ family response regulator
MKVIIPAIKTVDTIDRKILSLMTDGKSIKEIAFKSNLTPHKVAARIREMKKYYQVDDVNKIDLGHC